MKNLLMKNLLPYALGSLSLLVLPSTANAQTKAETRYGITRTETADSVCYKDDRWGNWLFAVEVCDDGMDGNPDRLVEEHARHPDSNDPLRDFLRKYEIWVSDLGGEEISKKLIYDNHARIVVLVSKKNSWLSEEYDRMEKALNRLEIAYNTGIYGITEPGVKACYQDLRKNPSSEYCSLVAHGDGLDFWQTPAFSREATEEYSLFVADDVEKSPLLETKKFSSAKVTAVKRDSELYKSNAAEFEAARKIAREEEINRTIKNAMRK